MLYCESNSEELGAGNPHAEPCVRAASCAVLSTRRSWKRDYGSRTEERNENYGKNTPNPKEGAPVLAPTCKLAFAGRTSSHYTPMENGLKKLKKTTQNKAIVTP
ncbi:MAG: hypothetical protein K2W92_02995 [Alphaproteobacteria bacterium]|nr:hypothetical protein [Alphaproteobacteria bacterium]